jgi:hypothetical protein
MTDDITLYNRAVRVSSIFFAKAASGVAPPVVYSMNPAIG